MTRIIPLYIPVPLAAEYRRRKAGHPTSAQILRSFPAGGHQKVSVEVATLMLEDARRQLEELADQNSSAAIQNYKGLMQQIERRFGGIDEVSKIARTVVDLRRVVSLWKAEVVCPEADPRWDDLRRASRKRPK